MKKSIGIKDLALTTIVDEKGTFLERIVQDDLKNHVIPSCSITEGEGEWIIYFSEGEFGISYDSQTKTINYRNNNSRNAEWDVLHLARQTLERQLQEKSRVSFHSASLGYNGKGVIFFGGSGSGKSSIVLAAANKKGFDYISNEISVIDSNQTIAAGTNLLVLKKGALERTFPDLVKKGEKTNP